MKKANVVLVAKCSVCKGLVRVTDKNWVVPHFHREGKKSRLCRGSSTRTGNRVVTSDEVSKL